MRTCLGIVGALLLCLAGVIAYFWLFRWSTETEVATRMASEFLARHALNLEVFEGPEIFDRPNVERIFIWRSDKGGMRLRLDVSPNGDMVCLLEQLEEKNFRRIACDLPK